MIEKFECTRCGWCCKNLNPKAKSFVPGFQSDLIISLSPLNLYLLPWEKDMLPKENVVIVKTFFDMLTDTSIILNYGLNITYCPFIKDNLCTIHDKARPFICSIYPCPYGYLDILKEKHFSLKFHCEAELPKKDSNKLLGIEELDNRKIKFNYKILAKNLYDRYGMSYIHKYLIENRLIKIIQILVKLESKGIIKLARKTDDFNKLKTRIEKSKKVDADDFIKEKTGIDLREMFSEKSIEAIKKVLES